MRELKTIIDQPGVYNDISEASYHADPCPTPSVSSSILKTINKKAPLQAYMEHPRLNRFHEPKKKAAFDLGTAAHTELLGTGAEIVVLDFGDYRTKAAKEERAAVYALDKTPILVDQYKEVKLMAQSARHQLSCHDEGGYFLEDGYSEQTVIWKEGDNFHRCRNDRITLSRSIIFDYKTTGKSAHPDEFRQTAINLGYDLSADHYLEGDRQLFDHEPMYRWVVQETEHPYALSVVAPTPKMLEVGRLKRQKALAYWNWCLKNNKWPSYPPRTVYIDPPVYEAQKWLDEEGDPLTSTKDEIAEVMKAWENWDAPLPIENKKDK